MNKSKKQLTDTPEFEYFDGREDCHDEFWEWERESVEIEMDETTVLLGSPATDRYAEASTVFVEPPTRVVYPRRVESEAEARALYLNDEITIEEFEHYLDRLIDTGEIESVPPSDEPETTECPLFEMQVKEKCEECGDVVSLETRDKCVGCPRSEN